RIQRRRWSVQLRHHQRLPHPQGWPELRLLRHGQVGDARAAARWPFSFLRPGGGYGVPTAPAFLTKALLLGSSFLSPGWYKHDIRFLSGVAVCLLPRRLVPRWRGAGPQFASKAGRPDFQVLRTGLSRRRFFRELLRFS